MDSSVLKSWVPSQTLNSAVLHLATEGPSKLHTPSLFRNRISDDLFLCSTTRRCNGSRHSRRCSSAHGGHSSHSRRFSSRDGDIERSECIGLNGNTRRTSSITHPITVNELHQFPANNPTAASNSVTQQPPLPMASSNGNGSSVVVGNNPDSIVVNNEDKASNIAVNASWSLWYT